MAPKLITEKAISLGIFHSLCVVLGGTFNVLLGMMQLQLEALGLVDITIILTK